MLVSNQYVKVHHVKIGVVGKKPELKIQHIKRRVVGKKPCLTRQQTAPTIMFQAQSLVGTGNVNDERRHDRNTMTTAHDGSTTTVTTHDEPTTTMTTTPAATTTTTAYKTEGVPNGSLLHAAPTSLGCGSRRSVPSVTRQLDNCVALSVLLCSLPIICNVVSWTDDCLMTSCKLIAKSKHHED